MRIEKKKLQDLVPADYNPRKDLQPGEPEYEKIKKSILEFGMVDPIIWNETSGNIVGGHQRFKVLQDLGHTEVDVSVVTLDDSREKALNVALNKVGGEFDNDRLYELLNELDESGYDVTLTGFGYDELADILSSAESEDEMTNESHYTDKIKGPEYEPKELEAPPIKSLYNDDRAAYLTYDIEKADIPDDVKAFLKVAAARHTVFDYGRIAEYYSHAPKEIQELMEQSALIIIDYNKAISYGFTELASVLMDSMADEDEGSDDDGD